MTKRNQTVVHYAEVDDSEDESAFITLKRKPKKSKKRANRSNSSDVNHSLKDSDDYNHSSSNVDNTSSQLPSHNVEKRRERTRRHSQMDSLSKKRKRRSISHSRSLKSLGLDEDGSSLEDDDDIGTLATSKRRRSSRDLFPDMLLRRSNRKKKAKYSTLNLSTMEEDAVVNDDGEERIRRDIDKALPTKSPVHLKKPVPVKPELRSLLIAQGKSPDDAANIPQPDIYTSIKSRQRQPKKFFDVDDNVDPVDVPSGDNSERGSVVEKEHKEETVPKDGVNGEIDGDDGGDDDNDDNDDNVVTIDDRASEKGSLKNGDKDEDEDGDDDDDNDESESESESDSDDDDDDDDENVKKVTRKKYQLRKRIAQPRRLVYEIRRESRRTRSSVLNRIPNSRIRRRRRHSSKTSFSKTATTPYQQKERRTYSQGATSTSSSSCAEGVNDDERKFERRKEKSMAKARNRCLPMNLNLNDLNTHGLANERKKIGSSLADIDPMNIDKSVKFDSIGGHYKHIRSLKEMVVFPLMYPEVFQKFHINPPRGCLFYGPPGTGKTLMARALANECSTDGRKVAFFMRKGADCLSKWVGESERQLRLLFDQAYQMRPSIIFFDEIDGLAPVRSSRQDQIHSSIVSTLLGLMDGLDNRGEIIVIGATNRIDSIDPALRRPGRFDREFLFSLPDKKARRDIIAIHTRKWDPPLSEKSLDGLAEKTSGYCGADLMSLCAESALFALRRRYPQIYSSSDKLKLNVDNINIQTNDFYKAMKNIVPTAQRSASNPARSLRSSLHPLLFSTLQTAITQLAKLFPLVQKRSKLLQQSAAVPLQRNHVIRVSESESEYDDTDLTQNRFKFPLNGISLPPASSYYDFRETKINRPRLLLCGEKGDGHTSHLAPAIFYDLEGLPVHVLDIPVLFGTSTRTPEEACTQIFREALRTSPSVVYMPDAPLWWEATSITVHHTFKSMLRNLPPHTPLLFIATANCRYHDLPVGLLRLFRPHKAKILTMKPPSEIERLNFFSPLFYQLVTRPPTDTQRNNPHKFEVLEKVTAPPGTELTEKELKKIESQEESIMRNLRLFLRDVLTRLAQDRRFKVFLKPVDTDEVPDYTEVIEEPMDVSTMMKKIDQHHYANVASFVNDINLICRNALEYNPEHRDEDRAIRHRACLLKDMAHAIIEQELDPNFELRCNEVIESRKRRNADPLKFAPGGVKTAAKKRLSSHLSDTNRRSSKKRRRLSSDESSEVESKKVAGENQDDINDDDNVSIASKKSSDQQMNSHHDKDVTSPREDDHSHSDSSNTKDEIKNDDNDRDDSMDSDNHEKIASDSSNHDSGTLENQLCSTPQSQPSSSSVSSLLSSLSASSAATSADEEIKDQSESTELKDSSFRADDSFESLETPIKLPHTPPTPPKLQFSDVSMVKIKEEPVESQGDTCNSKVDVNSPKSDNNLNNKMTEELSSSPRPELIIDEMELKNLFYYTAQVTSRMRVEDLDNIYSSLVRCVFRYQDSYDKTELIQELREEVDMFVKIFDEDDSDE